MVVRACDPLPPLNKPGRRGGGEGEAGNPPPISQEVGVRSAGRWAVDWKGGVVDKKGRALQRLDSRHYSFIVTYCALHNSYSEVGV